jgi:hypothetical protein
MATLRPLPAEARQILALARTDRAAAREALSKQPLETQVRLVCETPVKRRAELLSLAEEPEKLIPALPPAELCYTAKAVGLEDAGWLLEHATPSQIAACVDLDTWRDLVPDRARFGEWVRAFADAGEEALLRASHAVDIELLVLHLRWRITPIQKPGDEGWSPPPGAQTLDGQFYVVANYPSDDLEDLLTMLRVLFQQDYWFYFRRLQGAIWELDTETEEWALRWRSGRLQDLGFPPWEEAMRIYGYLRPEQRSELAARDQIHPVGEWPLPVWMPSTLADVGSEHALFRAIAALPEDERRPLLYSFIALANAVAVADRMPLGDSETLPAAIDKAARGASVGLEFLERVRAVDATEVLRRTSLERLFRIGVSEDRFLGPPAGTLGDEDRPPDAAVDVGG